MTAVQLQTTASFMKLVYQGGARSHPDNQRTLVKEDQESELVNLVQEVMAESGPPTEEAFVKLIYKAFKVTAEEMENTKCRKRELVWARQLHMVVRNQFFRMSLAAAAEVYGKDHATTMHSCKTVFDLMDSDAEYRKITKPVWKMWKNSEVELPDRLKGLSTDYTD